MYKKDPENIKINNFQEFLGKKGSYFWAQEERLRYYEKNLVDLRKLCQNEENNKLISEYTNKIEEIKDKLPGLKAELKKDELVYQKMFREYQTKTLPDKYKKIDAIITWDKGACKQPSKEPPFSTLTFAVPTKTTGTIRVSYEELTKITVRFQNFEIGVLIYQWTSIRNNWYKWMTITSEDMTVDF